MIRTPRARWATALLACAGALAAAPASAQFYEFTSWGTPGSLGIVDEADTGKVALNERIANFKSTATLPAKAILRYNFPAGALGMWGGGGGYSRSFHVRFLDNGPAASISIKLKQSNYNSNTITTVWNWSSDAVSSAPSSSYRTSWDCIYGTTTDFKPFNTYWLEVEMNKTDSTGSVGLAEIFIERSDPEACPF
jgi:hypothetical protein